MNRTLVVGEQHTALQTRRQEKHTQEFKQRMKHRNAIEGTQSELVRGHGARHARYRGLAKTKLQNSLLMASDVSERLRQEVAERAYHVCARGATSAPSPVNRPNSSACFTRARIAGAAAFC